jgi:transcriptional regulator with XRE-family HTH domain
MVLLRHLLGDALRRLRLRQGRTLREVSASARVSLGYLSEVERGQKEASSELLAAICSALGIPLSQVLREVSDNFALAELQSEPVFADVIEPAIEVAGVGHGQSGEDSADQDLQVSTAGSARGRVPAAAGSRLGGAPAQVSASSVGAGSVSAGSVGAGPVRAGHLGGQIRADQIRAELRPGQKITVPAGLPLGSGMAVGDPAFDQVTRTAREITNMVPV